MKYCFCIIIVVSVYYRCYLSGADDSLTKSDISTPLKGKNTVEPPNNGHVWDPLFSGHFVLC